MANTPITNLPQTVSLAGIEVVLGVQNGSSVQIPISQIIALAKNYSTAPVNTTNASYALASTDSYIIYSGSSTATFNLGTASNGRVVTIKTVGNFAVNSSASNVIPLAGGAAGTSILSATAGKFVQMVGDGTNWNIMMGN